MITPNTRIVTSLCALFAMAGLAGCGAKLSGEYSDKGRGFFETMNFKSDGKVEITFMGMTKEGDFVIEDKKVKVTVGGDTQIFTLDDDGCVDGGGMLGKYCKK